ncbi:MAG: SLC13 family permease [Pirellulales bacterium]
MFISNTAATAIVFPIALRVLALLDEGRGKSGTKSNVSRSHFGTAVLLMTAYASSVGGIATPIGTTTNVVARAMFKQADYFGKTANFFHWSVLGIPMAFTLFILLYLGLRWYGRRAELDLASLRNSLLRMRADLGPWNQGEINTAVVFGLAILCWTVPGCVTLFDENIGTIMSDYVPEEIVAILIPVALFLLPSGKHAGEGTLRGNDLSDIDWGALVVFGAGLSLGALVRSSGLADQWAGMLQTYWPDATPFVVIGFAAFAGIFLSEFSSNTAAAQILIPVIWPICVKLGVDPLGPMMAVTFAASFGSALPVSTPPNTLVYSSGKIPLRRMAVVGIGFEYPLLVGRLVRRVCGRRVRLETVAELIAFPRRKRGNVPRIFRFF